MDGKYIKGENGKLIVFGVPVLLLFMEFSMLLSWLPGSLYPLAVFCHEGTLKSNLIYLD